MRHHWFITLTLLLALSGCAATPATGAGVDRKAGASLGDDAQVVERISAEGMELICAELGYLGTRIDEDGDLYVTMQGYEVLMLVGTYDGVYVSLVTGFRDSPVGLKQINAWNRDNRFSRAYLDRDGDPIVEAELDLAGGVTIARIKDFVRTFGTLSLPEFVLHIQDRKAHDPRGLDAACSTC